MDPSRKHYLRSEGFSVEVERIESGRCPECAVVVDMADFRDAASRHEFDVSGLCQDCQDEGTLWL